MRTSLAASLAHVIAGAAIVAAGADVARADAPRTVEFSPVALAIGIELPADLASEVDSGELTLLVNGQPGVSCPVALSDGRLQRDGDGTCPQLWEMTEPATITVRFEPAGGSAVDLRLAPKFKSTGERLTLSKGVITLPASVSADIRELAVLHFDNAKGPATGWSMVKVEGGHAALDETTAAAAARLGNSFRAYALDPKQGVLMWIVAAAGAATENPAPGPTDPTGPATTLQVLPPGTPIPAALACPPKILPNPDMIVVCVDATGPQMSYRVFPEGARNVKPNRYFFVHVVHPTTHHPSVVLEGQIGSWVPGSRGHIDVQADGGGLNLKGSDEPTITLTSSSRTFAPRRPGAAPLTITLFDNQRAQVGDPLGIEFWIEETYSGAFRAGIAGIFLGGVERRHHAVTRGNSLQPEIEVSGRNLMDVDLMLGYSPYLDSGGRAATGCDNAPFCFNPYFGIGLVSVDGGSGGGGIDWLKSVHLGVEWEISPAFAVAVTANLRRVQRLAGGLHPGDPIEGDIPTENRYVFGVGLVVNLSPAFFKIGAGGAAALIR